MKSGPRIVAAFVSALAIAVTGAVNAAATQQASPQEGAVQVQELHDALADAANAGDVAGTKSVLGELAPLLTELESGQRYAVKDSSRELADSAGAETETTSAQVEQLFPDEQQSKLDLPSVAELLNVLVQRLLVSLSSLVNDLLGGVPLSV